MADVFLPATEDDDPEQILRQTRERFIDAFPGRCRSIRLLADTVATIGMGGPIQALRRIVHQLTGLAGTVGFPSVSERSADLETLIMAAPTIGVDLQAMLAALDDVRAAFDADARLPPPAWAAVPASIAAAGDKVLVVEDERSQQALVVAMLRRAGFRTAAIGNGAEAVDAVRFERPALVLLDIDLPGANGYEVCRRLKASTDCASIPVLFMTSRGGGDDRWTGLALGADDYLTKPVDQRELALRIRRLIDRAHAPAAAPASSGQALTYEAFALAAQEVLRREAGSLALLRVPREEADQAAGRLIESVRRKDLVGRYDANHLLLLLPGVAAPAACAQLRDLVTALRDAGVEQAAAGVAGTTVAASTTIEALLAEADEALNEARYLGEASALRSDKRRADSAPARARVLLADDDPDVMRIVDSQMRAAGYDTTVVFDGHAALAAAGERTPDLMVIDLMMPKLTGFDVLRQLHTLGGSRPRTLVLSARGREEDVTRAFELGADDYMTKPFSPQELMARAARLLR